MGPWLSRREALAATRGVASQPWGGQKGGLWGETAVRTSSDPLGAGALLLCSQTGGERQTGSGVAKASTLPGKLV